jgi:hypothetical protein
MILGSMIGAVFGASLILSVSLDAGLPLASHTNADVLTWQQKRTTVRRLVTSANECIARMVSADPRFDDLIKTGNVNELIVESVPSCVDAVRRMIDGYDRMFGHGAGETFFVGPYLDGLPAAVNGLVSGEDGAPTRRSDP